MEILHVLLFIIFLTLSAIHFNWVLGGNWGFEQSIPKTKDGDWVMKPKKMDSAIVGLGLLFFGVFYLIKGEVIFFPLPGWGVSIATWLIPSIFLLRAMGDFRYVGFFKKIKSTEFARNDTKYYSPLCLTIAVIGFIIGII